MALRGYLLLHRELPQSRGLQSCSFVLCTSVANVPCIPQRAAHRRRNSFLATALWVAAHIILIAQLNVDKNFMTGCTGVPMCTGLP